MNAHAALGASLAILLWVFVEAARPLRWLGSWRVISWALVLSLPVTLALGMTPVSLSGVGGWDGLAYASLFGVLIGFWYRGLAVGGIAAGPGSFAT